MNDLKAQNVMQQDSGIIEAKIQFDTLSFHLGNIAQGVLITRTFHFENTGTDSLIILSAVGDCSCTVPKFSEDTCGPGAGDSIEVTHNSTDNIGRFIQYVTVLHNAEEGYTFLKLSGFIEVKC